MWLTSGWASGRKTLLQYSSLTPLERECYEGEVPPYRKTDYKPIRMTPPLFPPDLWNVNIQTMSGGSCTNNLCEAWNRGFRSLVVTSHPIIRKALEHIRLDPHNVKRQSSWNHVVNHLRSEYKKSPNNYKILFNLC